jgi:hypothetical protein
MPAKPKGWDAFDAMAHKLVTVPKEKLEAKIAADKKARIKARKRKK